TDDELSRTDCFHTDVILIFIMYSMICFSIVIVFLAVLASHIFYLLKIADKSMSEKTRRFHHIMTKSIATQNSYPSNYLVLYPLSVTSMHSFVNSMVVLSTTPLFRRALRDL
ncbi:hypothetical protein PMAYCL1PPCAC_26834, partial [Pristionchus mayeri]